MDYFIIFDLEWTTWEGDIETIWLQPGQYREIVQIGALKVDRKTLEIIDTFNQLVRPTINPHLSHFFQKLTGISQEQVDAHGLSFPAANDAFSDFCGHALVFAYGSDVFVLGENAALNHCHPRGAFDKYGMKFVNIGPYINRIDPGSHPYNSGRLWEYFKLPKPMGVGEHDALFDCYSIHATMKHLIGQGHLLPI